MAEQKTFAQMNNFELEHVIRANNARLVYLQASFQEMATQATVCATMGMHDNARSFLNSLGGYLAEIEQAYKAIEAASDQLTHNLTVAQNSLR